MSDAQIEEFQKRASLIDDKRPEDVMSVVYDDNNPQCMDTPSEPGLYKILDIEGDSVECLIGFCADNDICGVDSSCGNAPSCHPCCGGSGYDDYSRAVRRDYIVISKDGAYNKVNSYEQPPVGELITPMSDLLRDEEQVSKTMSSGSAYCVFNPATGEFYEPFKVVSKRSVGDGVTVLKVKKLNRYGSEYEIRHNPEYDGFEPARGVLGAGVRFVKVSTQSEKDDYAYDDSSKTWTGPKRFSLASKDVLDGWVYGANLKKASVYCQDGRYAVQTGAMLQTQWGSALQAEVFLVKDLAIPAPTAREILDKVANTGVYRICLELPAHEKQAGSVMRMLQQPNFEEDYDSDFGVAVQEPQMFDLETEAEYMRPPAARIGDAYDPTLGGPGNQDMGDDMESLPEELLMSAPPEMLPQLAQQMGVPHVLEHGVVGNLISTYDSVAMMEKYIPKMEAGVDVCGRSLFLFYWKPFDFEKAYGTDDMHQLENEILSNFKSFGDLVLNLLRRNRKRQTSSPSRGV
jgi:hypothetical protein